MQGAVEALRERELLGIVEGLVAEDQHRIPVHAGTQLLERVPVMDLAQIDRADLGREVGGELAESDGHGVPLMGSAHSGRLAWRVKPAARIPGRVRARAVRRPAGGGG